MKKALSILLVLAMALSLCGCDSADYKKAMEAFDNGDYMTARAIFVELGDYEDSAHMVVECDYQQALQYMEDGKYAEARELFLQLDGYEESAAKAMQVARHMLIDYVEEKGEIVQSEDGMGTVIMVSEGKLLLAYVVKITGMINVDIKVGTLIDTTGNTFDIAGEDTTYSYAAGYEAKATATWDISTYKNGDVVDWEEFEVDGTTAQGTAYTKDTTWLRYMSTTALKNVTPELEKVLEESGLGLTMADIGFTVY